MLHDFLQDNLGKLVMLVLGNRFDGTTAELKYHGRDWWIVGDTAFHITEVSSYGYYHMPYIVVGLE